MRVKIVEGEYKGKTGEIVGTLWGAGLTIVKLDDTNDEVALTPYDFIPIRDKEEEIQKSTSNKEIIMQDIIVTKEMLEQLRTQFDDKNYAKILDIIKPVKVSQLDLSLESLCKTECKTKTEDYIMLGGKKIPFTVSKEKLIELGLVPEEKISPFERVNAGKYFWYIRDTGLITMSIDTDMNYQRDLYKAANYCTDQELILQRSLHERLSRLLWRFTMENQYDNIDWGKDVIHYISMNINTKKFHIDSKNSTYVNENVCYFYTAEIAQRAIDEIIKPFMEKNPKFVW